MFKTELEYFLNEQKIVDFISVAVKKTPEEYKKLSDFERFALVCERSDAILGSEVIRRFIDLICDLAKENLNLNCLKSRYHQTRVWRLIHGGDFLNSDVLTEPRSSCVDYCKIYDNVESLDIIEYISELSISLPKTLDDFIENVENSGSNSFLLDINEFKYIRPDEYHAYTVYQKILSGEKYRKDEIGLLVSHVICNIGKRKKCSLRVKINNDITCIAQLYELFEKRNADVEISICFDLISCNVFEQIFDIMLQKGKKISSEIIIPEDADIDYVHKRITELLDTIPFSRIIWQKDYTAYIDKC